MDLTFGSVSHLVYITAASAMLYGICAYSSAMLSHGAAFDILYDLRMRLMEKMGKISSGYYTSNTQGSLKKLLIEDVEQIEIFIAHSMCEVAAAIATPLFTIIVLFVTDWRLALVSLVPIVEEGTHNDLLRADGRYATLWKEQEIAGNWKLTK